ncbi:MAG: hypothetical protein RIS44_1025 [Pseudomonadota bacterium]|jgi:hypothetical protein
MIKTAVAVVLCALVSACGGGAGNDAKLRYTNLTTDSNGLSLYTGSDERIANINPEQLSGYVDVDAKTYDLSVKKGAGSALTTAPTTLSKRKHYTAVSWGRDGAIKFSLLDENQDAPNSGKVKLRVLNAAADAGSLDVYLTSGTDGLEGNTPTHGSAAVGTTTGFAEFNRGTYRLRVTAAGSKDDVRLDVPSLSFNDKQVATVILQSGVGGTLVNAYVLNQQSDLQPNKTNQVRVRLAAGVSGNGNVSAKVGSTTVSTGSVSPTVSGYVLAPAGDQAVLLQLAGATIFSATQPLIAGGDYTLLAYGSSALVQAKVLLDDNRPPSITTKTKIRLVHGAEGYPTLNLAVDNQPAITELAYGSASSFVNISPNSGNALMEVTSSLSNDPVYTSARTNSATTGVSLDAQNVYSLFILGGGTTARGILRRER